MGHVVLTESAFAEVVLGDLDRAAFKPGDRVRIATRAPIGHYRVPTYLRGKTGVVEMAIEGARPKVCVQRPLRCCPFRGKKPVDTERA